MIETPGLSQRTFRRKVATDFNAALQDADNSLVEDLATHLPNTNRHEPAVVPADSHQNHFLNGSITKGSNIIINDNTTISTSSTED